MYTKSFKIENITCGHCVHTIKTELNDLQGIESVKIDQESKHVEVSWHNPLTWNEIQTLLEEINFPPTE